MILKWYKFNESDNGNPRLTREIIQEVIFFREYTVFSSTSSLTKIYINFEQLWLILNSMDLSMKIESIDKIYDRLKEENDIHDELSVRDLFIKLYDLISKELEGFPHFYEMEDCVLGYVDDGYDIVYEFKGESMCIIIENYIDISEYTKLIGNSTQIVNRLKNFTKKEVFVCRITNQFSIF